MSCTIFGLWLGCCFSAPYEPFLSETRIDNFQKTKTTMEHKPVQLTLANSFETPFRVLGSKKPIIVLKHKSPSKALVLCKLITYNS